MAVQLRFQRTMKHKIQSPSSVKNGCKAVKKLSNRELTERPQNRHLKPWKPGRAPKSPGRPKTKGLLRELVFYLKQDPDMFDEYLNERIGGRRRLFRILDVLYERHPALLLYYGFGPPQPADRL
jgi:hypothetical protein